ncbi:MAG: hypothetical protein A4E63_00014 [Syntrophorhabdus sp. PtaU1.Bin050]|nr:MAG: hypothetical protein A4E63_00014 [Syntrophorhabdus sp. PtaU1.Bin050]
MHWRFRATASDEVEQEITQRDQFRNDEVDLSDTIVREAIQNSLDARRNGEIVRMRFALQRVDRGLNPEFIQQLFPKDFANHGSAAGINVRALDFECPTALVIEDFGTSGLTGSIFDRDDGHFCDFWRRMGKSHKTGSRLGRHGLGKIVFWFSSQLSAFFGVTVRAGDKRKQQFLMGQTVLNYHSLNGKKYAPHGFFAEAKSDEPYKGLSIPLTDEHLVASFMKNFSLKRANEPGLSIIVPFPRDDISMEEMIAIGIENYFFPILAEKLILDFDGVVIDSTSVREMALKYAERRIPEIEKLFDFIQDIKSMRSELMVQGKLEWDKESRLSANSFSEADLSKMQAQFESGGIVGVTLPITVETKEGKSCQSEFQVFVRAPKPVNKGLDMYIRSWLTIPNEAKFQHRKGFGVLLTKDDTDDAVATFLGDAENAAHTKWNSRAEKLAGYKSAPEKLRAIRNSVINLYDLLSEVTEEEERDALRDFFWTPIDGKSKEQKGKKATPPKPIPLPESRTYIRISRTRRGFVVSAAQPIPPERLPMIVRLNVAYDIDAANPFHHYSELDFDLRSRDFYIERKDVTVKIRDSNAMELTVEKPDFTVVVKGFDSTRDVIVRVDYEVMR